MVTVHDKKTGGLVSERAKPVRSDPGGRWCPRCFISLQKNMHAVSIGRHDPHTRPAGLGFPISKPVLRLDGTVKPFLPCHPIFCGLSITRHGRYESVVKTQARFHQGRQSCCGPHVPHNGFGAVDGTMQPRASRYSIQYFRFQGVFGMNATAVRFKQADIRRFDTRFLNGALEGSSIRFLGNSAGFRRHAGSGTKTINNRIDTIFFCNGVFQTLEHQCQSAFSGKGSLGRCVKRRYRRCSGAGSGLITRGQVAKIPGKIHSPHQHHVRVFFLQRPDSNFEGFDTGSFFARDHETGASQQEFFGNPARNDTGQGSQGPVGCQRPADGCLQGTDPLGGKGALRVQSIQFTPSKDALIHDPSQMMIGGFKIKIRAHHYAHSRSFFPEGDTGIHESVSTKLHHEEVLRQNIRYFIGGYTKQTHIQGNFFHKCAVFRDQLSEIRIRADGCATKMRMVFNDGLSVEYSLLKRPQG